MKALLQLHFSFWGILMVRGLLFLGLLILSKVELKAAEPNPELRAYGQQLVNIMEKQDRQTLADNIDFEQIFEQGAFGKCEFESPSARKSFMVGFLRASKDIENPFYSKFLPECEFVSLMQIKPVTEQESWVIVRYLADDSSQYQGFRVQATADKSFKVIDINNGSPVANFTAGLELAVLTMHKFQYIKKLGEFEVLRDWLTKNEQLFADFVKASSTDDADAIMKLYPQLSPTIQKLRLVEHHFYRANSMTEKPVLKLADMRAYYAKHRDAGTLQLVLGFCRSQGDLAGMLETYDEYDQLLGKDPLNNLHRAHLLVDLKKFPEAYERVQQLIKDYPEEQQGQITLMVVSLFDKNFKLTLQQLRVLRDKYRLNLIELVDTSDDYQDFRKSPEYAEWKKENAAAAVENKK